MSDFNSLRNSVNAPEYETDFGVTDAQDVSEGRIFGLTAGERMIVSLLLLMAAVLSMLILFATQTFVLQ